MSGGLKCRLCKCLLTAERPDNLVAQLCMECNSRPEAKQMRVEASTAATAGSAPAAFNIAEKSLIKKLQGFMPRQQLLDLLNERRQADLGPKALLHGLEALDQEIRQIAAAAPAAGDWGGMRKVLALARRDGTLQRVNRQVIDDFAVVFSLNAVQVLRLKDVVLSAADEVKGNG